MNPAVCLEDVTVALRGRVVLAGVSVQFGRGEFVGVIGPNGAGKTTLLTVVNGLTRIRAGEVTVLGQAPHAAALRGIRRRVGYVPQGTETDPRAPITCREVVAIGRLGRIGLLRRVGPADREAVGRTMATTGIVHLAERPIGQVSVGERQRVTLARALAQEPEILLLDEPFSNLDPWAVRDFTGLVADIHRRFRLTTIMVTHRLEDLPDVCDRVAMLRRGRVLFVGPRPEALEPDRVAALFSHE